MVDMRRPLAGSHSPSARDAPTRTATSPRSVGTFISKAACITGDAYTCGLGAATGAAARTGTALDGLVPPWKSVIEVLRLIGLTKEEARCIAGCVETQCDAGAGVRNGKGGLMAAFPFAWTLTADVRISGEVVWCVCFSAMRCASEIQSALFALGRWTRLDRRERPAGEGLGEAVQDIAALRSKGKGLAGKGR